jgi:bacillithiol biosynthesis deacetylase BshB1
MKIVAFGIHPDDVELGCGGTVAFAARAGHDVVVVDLTSGSSSSNGTLEERAAEARAAAAIMGVGKRYDLQLPDTGIQSENDEQTGAVVSCVRGERPDLVMLPSADDPHPDHRAGGRLIERALYLAGVRGYARAEPAWRAPHAIVYPGRNDLDPGIVFDITSTYEIKVKAILAHASQFVPGARRAPTPLNSPDFLRTVEARARTHGSRIGTEFGEGFRSAKPIALSDFRIFGG